ncbi:hypothetical protein FSP39_023638 [Pinctada imbricata]|uniref:G-protein coupled receptors family 1 profile domain-containing protein n=1 Tax=Pinctada imbricata TaxID=66713 RepID=A0AA89BTM5_PINIB|nr:hypothetical protein FSP39_023638 [Pinctada imbricata]
MVIVVAIAFILSWSPQFFVSIVSQHQRNSFLHKQNFFFTMLMTHLFGFINSCVNPFIYTAMSEKFRKSFRRTLKRLLFCNVCRCHQRYRAGSIFQRRSTGVTSATRSFIDPEEEPLQLGRGNRPSHAQSNRQSSSSDSSSKIDPRVYYSTDKENLYIDRYKIDQSSDLYNRFHDSVYTCSKRAEFQSDSDYASSERVLLGEGVVDVITAYSIGENKEAYENPSTTGMTNFHAESNTFQVDSV